MARWMNDSGADAALDYWTAAERLVLCSAQPADYAAVAGLAIAEAEVDGADFTKANGDVSGRKVTCAAQTGLLVDESGTITHGALVDDTNSRLLYVTTSASQAVTANGSNTVNTSAFKIELLDPVAPA